MINMETIEVRRHNGQCPYGPWRAATHADVPDWVTDMVADEIVENDADGGKVERGGSVWLWRKEEPR